MKGKVGSMRLRVNSTRVLKDDTSRILKYSKHGEQKLRARAFRTHIVRLKPLFHGELVKELREAQRVPRGVIAALCRKARLINSKPLANKGLLEHLLSEKERRCEGRRIKFKLTLRRKRIFFVYSEWKQYSINSKKGSLRNKKPAKIS